MYDTKLNVTTIQSSSPSPIPAVVAVSVRIPDRTFHRRSMLVLRWHLFVMFPFMMVVVMMRRGSRAGSGAIYVRVCYDFVLKTNINKITDQ